MVSRRFTEPRAWTPLEQAQWQQGQGNQEGTLSRTTAHKGGPICLRSNVLVCLILLDALQLVYLPVMFTCGYEGLLLAQVKEFIYTV